jgi:enoyl-CoA hydratase
MDYQNILVEKAAEYVTAITLNRPKKLNALSIELLSELTHAIKEIEDDDDVRVVIIKGAGKAFCAGIDVSQASAQDPMSIRKFMKILNGGIKVVRYLEKPVIAAVHGHAIGAGIELMISCDIVFAADNSMFSMPEINIGIPSIIEAAIIPRQIGILRAKEFVLTGDIWDAKRIEEVGFVNKIIPVDKLQEEALAMAKKLAKKSPIALAVQKDVCNKWMTTDLETAIDYSIGRVPMNFASEDQKEGMRAFLEKREPKFTGR